MKTHRITFTRAWPGHPINVNEAATVAADLPAGCAFRVLQGDTWANADLPYNAPRDVLVRVDCDDYDGEPVTAVITVTEAGE